ncbi:hypothetical protein [Rhizobium sp. P44RR-XXIV]|uniref:hypothetical protein n=1 Tax=Rhizobium sp. P44RR-XXIV TaxID=1921145 RepID=UPI00098550A8|nr:hypothetical protein [Rhizobium sp. P44RR-XXIV]TIX93113.1 hypothetical protein BSK43_002130 [Rhizobium sp. P44RR-XXIV]
MIRFFASVILSMLLVFGGHVVCPDEAEHSRETALAWMQAKAPNQQDSQTTKSDEHCVSIRLQADTPALTMTRLEHPATYSPFEQISLGIDTLPLQRPPIHQA